MSDEVERLKAENGVLSRKCSELENELVTVKAERDDYADTVDWFDKQYKVWQQKALTPEKRDRILASLEVGKQSALYKKVKAVLDQMLPKI